MTEEEARAKLRLIQIQKEKLALGSDAAPERSAPPVEIEGEGLDLQDVRGLGGALLKGSLAGFGDEFVGAARTGLDMLLPETGADRIAREIAGADNAQSLADAYRMHRDDARASDKEFERENSKTAIAANILGGVASPLNKVAPGFGSSRMGATARGGAEGALAGYGESEDGNVLRSVLTGAAFGGGAGFGLSSVGHMFGRTSGIDDLDVKMPDGSTRFKPLNLAADDDSLAGRAYRNTFGRSSGGGKLRNQEQPWLDDAAADVKNARVELDARKLDLGESARVESLGLEQAASEQKRLLAEDVRQETLNIDNQLDMLAAADLKPKQAVPRLPKAVKAVKGDARVAEPTVKFRRAAATESVPVRERDAIFDGVDVDDPEAADDAIYDFWQSDDAFAMVKGRGFELDDELHGYVKQVMETPESRSQLGEVVGAAKKRAKAEGFDMQTYDIGPEGEEIARKMTDDEMLEWAFQGQIDGDVLMELRNIYARGANSASGMSRGAQRNVANAFDKYIVRNIDDPDEYYEHVAAYPNSITHGKAVAGNKANAAGGRYTIDEHQAAGKPLARRGADDPNKRSKKRPLQPQARAARAELEALEAPPAALPDATAADAAREANVAIDAANSGVERDIRRLSKTLRSQLADRTGRKRAAINSDAAAAAEELSNRTTRNKAALSEEAKTGPLGQASAKARELARKATPKGASGLSERLTDVMIGSAITPKDTPFLGKLAAGVGGALGGSTKPVQRRIAGQAWEQKGAQALARGLRGLTKEEQIIEMMNRGISREAAIQMTGD